MGRKWILIVSATASILLGLKHVGVTPLFPGKDLGLEHRVSGVPPRVELMTDSGDVTAKLELDIRVDGDGGSEWGAAVGGVELEVSHDRSGQRSWRLVVVAVPGSGATTKFLWPSGSKLRVSAPEGVRALEVVDWRVYLRDDSADSKQRAYWRRVWFWISLGLLAGSLLGSVYGIVAVATPAPAPLTRETLLTQIFDAVTGEDDQETDKMRRFLRRLLLEGASLDEALEAVGPFERPRDRLSFYPKALRRARDHLDFFLAELNRARSLVDRRGDSS